MSAREVACMWRLLSLQEKAHHERRAEGIREFHRTIRPTWQYSKRKDPTAGDKESASIVGTISSTHHPWLSPSQTKGVRKQTDFHSKSTPSRLKKQTKIRNTRVWGAE